MKPQAHSEQVSRLAALRSYDILDTPREQEFDEVVELAAKICETPISVINIIDEHRQWFKAEVGLGVRETPLETSICAHVILQPGLTVIKDTLADPRFSDNPLCMDEPNLRFYAGALLETGDGLPLGTLCVLDTKPRTLTDLQASALQVLANQVMARLDLRKALKNADVLVREVDHRVKNSLAMIHSLLRMQARAAGSDDIRMQLESAGNRVMSVASIHDQLVNSNSMSSVQLSEFLGRIVSNLSATAPANVTVSTDFTDRSVPTGTAVSIALFVNEMVTNALRHAFPNGEAGKIEVGTRIDGNRLRVVIGDDGIGLPEAFSTDKPGGLGMKVATAMAEQLGATLEPRTSGGGSTFELDFVCDGNG